MSHNTYKIILMSISIDLSASSYQLKFSICYKEAHGSIKIDMSMI